MAKPEPRRERLAGAASLVHERSGLEGLSQGWLGRLGATRKEIETKEDLTRRGAVGTALGSPLLRRSRRTCVQCRSGALGRLVRSTRGRAPALSPRFRQHALSGFNASGCGSGAGHGGVLALARTKEGCRALFAIFEVRRDKSRCDRGKSGALLTRWSLDSPTVLHPRQSDRRRSHGHQDEDQEAHSCATLKLSGCFWRSAPGRKLALDTSEEGVARRDH